MENVFCFVLFFSPWATAVSYSSTWMYCPDFPDSSSAIKAPLTLSALLTPGLPLSFGEKDVVSTMPGEILLKREKEQEEKEKKTFGKDVVSTMPGEILLTVIPWDSSSRAMVAVRPSSAN